MKNLPIYHMEKFKEPKNFNRIPLKMHQPIKKVGGVVPYNYSQMSIPKTQSRFNKICDSPAKVNSSVGSNMTPKHESEDSERISQ